MKVGKMIIKSKGFKRTVTPYEKNRTIELYGENYVNTYKEIDVYFNEDEKFPYSFHNYGTVCNVHCFKSIENIKQYIKKWWYPTLSLDIEFVVE